jgi:hypothetical protein
MVYGCDPAWWRHRNGLPDFMGAKVAWSGASIDFPDILRAEIERVGSGFSQKMLFGAVGRIGGGGNSGFQALNLSVQLGARRVLLIGFDMHGRGGVHWYGRNNWPSANNPDDGHFRKWLAAFNAAAPVLSEIGVEVINASPLSDLNAFPRRGVADTLKEWGLS